ncbi:MAG: hypothetical protein Q7R41_11455 [Phycisphaerales bacterium]|nr:hypothetical protein [Phycisphaerales bacterium]
MTLSAFLATADAATYVTELRRIPEGWYAVGALALAVGVCWLVIWMYRREGRIGASPRVRLFLGSIRCAILIAMGVILLEPVRVRIVRRWIESFTVVLLDTSSSMDLADRYRDLQAAQRVQRATGDDAQAFRRMDLAERILEGDDRRFLRNLTNNNSVRLYAFDSEAKLVATLPAESKNPPEPLLSKGEGEWKIEKDAARQEGLPDRFEANGATTNLERAIRRSVESLGNAPIAGVVVLSDGGLNAGASADDIARYARERRVPVHVVGIGDSTAPRNARVTEILAPANALQKDPFVLTAMLAAEGLNGERIRVELREQNLSDGGEPRLLATKDVTVAHGGAIEPVTFERRAERIGRYVYSVQVPPVQDESITEDNVRQAAVNVVDASTRVLLISGEPSWTYRYLAALLQRDDTINVSCWLQSAEENAVRDGDTIIDHLPVTAEELFAYDVIILLDPDRTELDEAWCRLVDKLVTEYGGGVLYEAARPHTPSFVREPSVKPLLDLLPVSLDPEADLVLNQIGHYQMSRAAIEIPPAAAGHPVLRITDDAVSDRLAWQGVADVFWHYPVLREKPVATVLMRHGNPRMRNNYGGHVLTAVQFAGAGRSAFLGLDATWRWRRYGPEWFDRFWVQMIRFLAEGKLLAGSGRGTLLVDKERPALGEAVTVSARILNERYEPLRQDRVEGSCEVDEERAALILESRQDRPGWFEGRFVPDRPGHYRIRVPIPGAPGESRNELERELVVSRPNLEILRPQMHRAELTALAEHSAGGRFWEVDETAELAKAIPDLHEEVPVRSRPVTLWDNWKVLALLVTLMSLEWAVRKWNRLL